jgi:hypothetical protein
MKFALIVLVCVGSHEDHGSRRDVSLKIDAEIESSVLESPVLPIRSICWHVQAVALARLSPLSGTKENVAIVHERIRIRRRHHEEVAFPNF